MKQNKKNWNKFDSGLFLVGSRDDVPDGFLRRARGTNPIRTMSARSRHGSNLAVANIPANCCISFGPSGNDFHYFGTATGLLYREAVQIDSGYNGNQLSFVKAPPQIQDADYLFISNGGKLTKSDSTGAISNWGIAQPASQPTLAASTGSSNTNQIDAFDNDHANWTTVFGSPTVTDEGTFYVEGAGSMKVVTPAGTLSVIKKSSTKNLGLFTYTTWAATTNEALGAQIKDSNGNLQIAVVAGTTKSGGHPTWSTTQGGRTADGTVTWVNYGTAVSTTSDFIEMWIGVDNPDNLEFVSLRFDLGAVGGPDAYHARFDVAALNFVSELLPPGTPSTTAQALGVNNLLQGTALNTAEADFIKTGTLPSLGNIADPQVLNALLAFIHVANITRHPNDWTRIRLAKSQFLRKGVNAAYDWRNVVGIEIAIQATASGNVTTWFDDLTMIGGYGLEGNYQGTVVFVNTNTGSVSNPPTGAFASVNGVTRQAVTWTNIPVSTDPQVNGRLLYRTVGGGATPFYVTLIPNNTDTTFVDGFADFAGLNGGGTSQLILGNTAIYPIQLQFDNAPPLATFGIAAGPYQGSVFWTYPPQPERVYYSPIGRPESIENYITSSYNDDGILTLFVFNGSLYALGAKRLYQIQQVSASPLLYTIVPILGVPGIVAPFAGPVVGKNGVAWQAPEGIVLFNGFTTTEMDLAIQPLFRGETAENYTFSQVKYAIYTKGEFWFSDGINDTLAMREDNGAWRSVGLPLQSLCWDESMQLAHGTYNNNVLFLEVPGVFTDNGSPINWEVQVGGLLIGEDVDGTVARLEIDINTNNQVVTPTIVVGDADTLPLWVGHLTYVANQRVLDSNNNVQKILVAGLADGATPLWSTQQGGLTTDGLATWICEGPGVFTLPTITTPNRQIIEYTPKFKTKRVTVRLNASLTIARVELFNVLVVTETGT